MSNVCVAVIVAVVLLALPERDRLPWQLHMAQIRRSAYVPQQDKGEP